MRSATMPSLTPYSVATARARNRRWCVENRGVKRRCEWLLGAPPFGTHLPGGGFELSVSPAPRWKVELRNTRSLHGLVTALGILHHPTIPQFTLVPWPTDFGWGVYTQHDAAARAVAGREHRARLFDQDVTAQCGPLARLRAPVVTHRGRRRLRIDAITPVCVRADQESMHTMPTSENLHSTLASWLPRRLGIEVPGDELVLELVSRETQPATVETGGKFGATRGFVGHCIVETNAVGEWLLRVSALIGLGGRVAFGFGRVRVSNVD